VNPGIDVPPRRGSTSNAELGLQRNAELEVAETIEVKNVVENTSSVQILSGMIKIDLGTRRLVA